MLSLILKGNSLQRNGKDYLKIHRKDMESKMAVAFANILMARIEQVILRQNKEKPLVWKRFIDDIFIWDTNKEDIELFIEKANAYHPIIKCTDEV